MTNRIDETTLPELLDEAANAAPRPLDHGRLQQRGRRRRRTHQLAAGGASLSVLAALAITLPTVLPSGDAPLLGGGPDTPEATERDDSTVTEIRGQGCPEPIASTWTCLAPEVRPAAPEPNIGGLDRDSFELASVRGQIAVLTFWADWCGPCETQQPDIEQARASATEVAFIEIALETQPDDATRYAQTHNIDGTVLLDLDSRYLRELNDTLGNDLAAADQTAIPATYVLDREGRIAAWSIGQTNERDLFAAIERATG